VNTSASTLTLADAARMMREAMRNKTYQLTPLGMESAEFLRFQRKRLAKNSLDAYESTLNAFALNFPDLTLADFEPPAGIALVETFLDAGWGDKAPTSYNRHLSALRSFFRFQVARQKMTGDPTLVIEPARKRQLYRETFTGDQCRAIIASQDSLRDRIAVRLMVNYGLRRGGMLAIQFKHFDHVRRQLSVFLKGGKVQRLPIPEQAFWHDLERLILDVEAQGTYFLMCGKNRAADRPMSPTGFHKWWYRSLAKAGVVAEGTTSGERPHKARHTAGQRVLDGTRGNLKATQKFLGHTSVQTTADIYTDWDVYQLEETLAEVYGEDDA